MSSPASVSLRAATVLVVLLAVAACGESETERPDRVQTQRLSAAERAAAESGYDAIRGYCRRLGLYLAGRRAAPPARAQGRAVAGARRISSLARRKPEAPYSATQTVRELAGDTAEDLEGTNCSSQLVAELTAGL